jgi:hypothetical protein
MDEQEKDTEMKIINPEDLPKRRVPVDSNSKENGVESVPIDERFNFKLEYCTLGRFSAPKEVNWRDYSFEHVTTLTTSNQDEILNTLLTILNKMHNHPTFDINECTPDELIETLVNLKFKYRGGLHEHRWLCECQYGIDEDNQQVNTSEIDLSKVNFDSIEEADKNLRKIFKSYFEESNDNFEQYLTHKYPNKKEDELKKINIEQALNDIFVKEPFKIIHNNHTYTFRFPRMKDLVMGEKEARAKYKREISKVQNKKIDPNKDIRSQKEAKKGALEVIKRKIGKDALIYSRAFCMTTKNDQPISNEEKYNDWKEFPPSVANEVTNFINAPFGLNAEYDLFCPHCEKTFRRSLRQEPTLVWELLPLDDTSGKSESGQSKRPFVHLYV